MSFLCVHLILKNMYLYVFVSENAVNALHKHNTNIAEIFYITFSFKLSSVYSPINCYHEDYSLNYVFEYDYVGDHFELSLSELADIWLIT